MGGIGISLNSQEGGKGPTSTPLTNLPEKVVDEIAKQLGIQTPATRQALTTGKIPLPDDVEVTITRLSTKGSITITKKGSKYTLKYGDKTVELTP